MADTHVESVGRLEKTPTWLNVQDALLRDRSTDWAPNLSRVRFANKGETTAMEIDLFSGETARFRGKPVAYRFDRTKTVIVNFDPPRMLSEENPFIITVGVRDFATNRWLLYAVLKGETLTSTLQPDDEDENSVSEEESVYQFNGLFSLLVSFSARKKSMQGDVELNSRMSASGQIVAHGRNHQLLHKSGEGIHGGCLC